MNSVLPSVAKRLASLLSHLGRDRRGSIALMGAFSILALIGVASLTVELGQGYSRRAINQHITDEAAYAAAFYYTDGGTSNVAAMTQAAQDLASANGVPNSAVSFVMLPTSPGNSSKSAVQVNITTQIPISLAGLFNIGNSFPVTTTAIVEVNPGGACIISLNPNSNIGVYATVLAAINANQCAIASATTVSVGLLAAVCGKSIYYGGSRPSGGFLASIYTNPNCPNGGNTNAVYSQSVASIQASDPLKSSNRVQNTFTKLNSGMPTAAVPALTPNSAATGGCASIVQAANTTANLSGSCYNSITVGFNATVNINANSLLQIGSVTVNGGTLTINGSGYTVQTSGNVVVTAGAFNISGTPTTVDIGGRLTLNGGGFTIATARNFYVRTGSVSSPALYNNGGFVSIGSLSGIVYINYLNNNFGTINFASGAANFYITAISNSNTLTFGNEGGFYLTSTATAFNNVLGTVTFGSGNLVSNGDFVVTAGTANFGGLNSPTGEYDINGNFSLNAGFVQLGYDALYVINGNFWQGAGTIFGSDDTVITSGAVQVLLGSFYEVSAPSNAETYAIRNVALASNVQTSDNDQSTVVFGLASGSLSGGGGLGSVGAFYFPRAQLNVFLGAIAATGCRQLIAASIEVSIGFAATSCPGLNGLNATAGSLIQ